EETFLKQYRDELQQIERRLSREKLPQIFEFAEVSEVITPAMKEIVLNLQTEANVRCRELDALRTLLAPHREPTGIARIVSALRRTFTRRIYGIGRPLADGGRAYAICGADGSGKSAVAKR